MTSCHELTTSRILTEFSAEIERHQGTVTDTFEDGRRLFVRSVLPETQFVQTADALQGGVALRATEEAICIHPYLFRQVCRNGAITAHTVASWELNEPWLQPVEETLAALRNSITACCCPEVFSGTVRQMRSAVRSHVDLAITLMPMLSRLGRHAATGLLTSLMGRFLTDGDRSRFGLINAVTATARDTQDPELRWRLEELGGGLIVETSRQPKAGPPLVARRQRVPVGAP